MANLDFDDLDEGIEVEITSEGFYTIADAILDGLEIPALASLNQVMLQSQQQMLEHFNSVVGAQIMDAVGHTVDLQVSAARNLMGEAVQSIVLPKIDLGISSAISALTSDIIQPFYKSLAKQFAPLLETISAAHARSLSKTLRRFHWWPVPGIPIEFYIGLLELIDAGQTRFVNRYICDWFKQNRYRRLGRMVNRWEKNQHFRTRRAIYMQALKAHRKGWYNVSVPCLLPLIEGLAVEYLKHEHLMAAKGEKAILAAIDKNVPSDIFEKEIQAALVQFLADSTYEQSVKVLPSGYELNRHGVLHGAHLHYGSEANSLRCFLWLETLYRCIDKHPIDVDWEVKEKLLEDF